MVRSPLWRAVNLAFLKEELINVWMTIIDNVYYVRDMNIHFCNIYCSNKMIAINMQPVLYFIAFYDITVTLTNTMAWKYLQVRILSVIKCITNIWYQVNCKNKVLKNISNTLKQVVIRVVDYNLHELQMIQCSYTYKIKKKWSLKGQKINQTAEVFSEVFRLPHFHMPIKDKESITDVF